MGGRISRRAVAAAAIVAAFMAVGVSPALATTVVCGQVITQNTKVSNDLTNCPGDGLVIGAGNIKLDLGKHTIDGDGVNAPTDDGIDNTGGFDPPTGTRSSTTRRPAAAARESCSSS